MKRPKKSRRQGTADAIGLMQKLNGTALDMHRSLTAEGFALAQTVRVHQRKDGTWSARFVWRQRHPKAMVGATVVNTAITVSWNEIFRLVPTR